MRYRDAPHLDLGSFYAREPRFGRMYRFLGYCGIIIAAFFINDPQILVRLLFVLIAAWLMAWYRVVGTLWRSSIVSAALLCAFLLTLHRVHLLPLTGVPPTGVPPTGTVPLTGAAP